MTNDQLDQLEAVRIFADRMLGIVLAVERADEMLARVMGRV